MPDVCYFCGFLLCFIIISYLDFFAMVSLPSADDFMFSDYYIFHFCFECSTLWKENLFKLDFFLLVIPFCCNLSCPAEFSMHNLTKAAKNPDFFKSIDK